MKMSSRDIRVEKAMSAIPYVAKHMMERDIMSVAIEAVTRIRNPAGVNP